LFFRSFIGRLLTATVDRDSDSEDEEDVVLDVDPPPLQAKSNAVMNQRKNITTKNSLMSFGFGAKKQIVAPVQTPILATVLLGKTDKYVKTTGYAVTQTKELQQCPKSLLARERIVPTNKGSSEPRKSLSELQKLKEIEDIKNLIRSRIKEHEKFVSTTEGAVVVLRSTNAAKTLWCDACHTDLKPKKSNVDEHLKTKKHLDAIRIKEKDIKKDAAARDYIKEYFESSHAKGETVNLESMTFRFETVQEFLANGIPLQRIDGCRDFLEKRSGLSLTDSSHMRKYIPPLLQKEIQTIISECKGNDIVVIFDGTTRVDEVFCIIFRWVTDKLEIKERLVEMGKYQHGFNSEELSSAIIKILTKYGIDFGLKQLGRTVRVSQVLAFQRDRCSVNAAAMSILTRNLIGSKDMECLSHTIQHCGDHLAVPILLRVKQDLCALIKESYHTKTHWLNVLGFQFRHPGNTRWFGTYEVYVVIKENFEAFYLFVTTAVLDGEVDEGGVRIGRLNATLTNEESRAWLRLEAEISSIVMKPLVEATYILEGKGPCAIIAYDLIKKTEAWFDFHTPQLSYPGVPEAMQVCTDSLTSIPAFLAAHAGNGQIGALVATKVRTVITGAIEYFRSRILGMLAEDVAIYKTLRYANPLAMLRANPPMNDLVFRQEVTALHHFSTADINNMVLELPIYRAHLQRVPEFLWEKDEMQYAQEFWDPYTSNTMPNFTKFVRYAFTMITSSGSAERAFSILKRSFGYNQVLALEDYVMLSCMLQKNRRDV